MDMWRSFILICTIPLICVEGYQAPTTPRFNFSGPIVDETCGLYDLESQWSLEGTVQIAKEDLVFFQEKVIIQTCSELCVVDLGHCSNDRPVSDSSCSCLHKDGDNYFVRLTATARAEQNNKKLLASIPALESFGTITSSVNIGTLPVVAGKRQTPKVTFRLNEGAWGELERNQTLAVCPDKFAVIDICVENPLPGSLLNISLGLSHVTTSALPCVDLTHKFNFKSSSNHDLKFTYKASPKCHHEDVFALVVEEAKYDCIACTSSQTDTAKSSWEDGACAKRFLQDPENASTQRLATLDTGLDVLCDRDEESANWIVFQQRTEGEVNFNRSWTDYATGFGEFITDFWLGLEPLHQLCHDNSCLLNIEMEYKGEPAYPSYVKKQADGRYSANYTGFGVADRSRGYRMTYSQFSSQSLMGNFLTNNSMFSTPDVINMQDGKDCVSRTSSGWWWASGDCYYISALNGVWGQRRPTGPVWGDLTYGGSGSQFLSGTRMKVLPTPA